MSKYLIKNLKSLYIKSKNAKVGGVCTCPSCGSSFIKSNYQQAFCKTMSGTICKDFYWNNVTPSKRNNTTRISPASVAWMAKIEQEREFEDFDDDQSWDAHKNSF